MKALICTTPGHMEYIDIPAPEMKKGQTIIRILRTGICGTDFHAYQGTQPYFNYPRILGHELAGEIVDSDGGEGFAPGDQVTFIPYYHCGECNACLRGKTNCCVKMQVCGVHVDGGMREYLSVPTAALIKHDGLSLDELALTEPLAIGAHGIRRAGVEPGESVLIVGAGPIGLGLMEFAKIAGAEVTVTDRNPERLEFGRKAGVQVTDKPGDITADVVIDATGNLAALNGSLQYLAHGGRYVLVGLQKEALTIAHPELHKREGAIMSSRNATRQDFELVTQSISSKRVTPADYITHRVQFGDLKALMENYPKKSIKVMVEY
ncbi:zinc-binding alcohol dehydrogenase family protein [Chitinophaga lutea]|uniref:Zinc-binding alcohol dehydrogenase family protein n=1 Tax=Chitinophaga lutea TaxID=2488634 RepID=A0A3N4Q7X1_9BACT|nr:zinc-binding alcohol dehydrogenase family protein [Chitinophaga lutea]RPE12167.1 zinc-binding alcohol dehydrogenase family protein [Chitinophaga lutea]